MENKPFFLHLAVATGERKILRRRGRFFPVSMRFCVVRRIEEEEEEDKEDIQMLDVKDNGISCVRI